MTIRYTVHEDDGTGHCAACGTAWPAECAVEKNTVWVADVDISSGGRFTPEGLISSASDDIDEAGSIPPGGGDRQCLYLAALAKLALADTLRSEAGAP